MRNLGMTLAAAAIGVAFGTGALASDMMTKSDYQAAKKRIEADYKGVKSGCDPMTGNARDICQAEASGREKVALAELQAAYKPSDKARHEVRLAKAKAVHAVAREKCDDKAGNAKDVCVKEADAAHIAAKADTKAQAKSTAARKDAAGDKRDADYAVAREKCDVLAGAPKEACVNDAKARYGKS